MTKEFIPYEQALALKELGFDEPCFGYYGRNKKIIMPKECINKAPKAFKTFCLTPTYSAAFRWFREKHKINSGIVPYYDYFYFIIKNFGSGEEYYSDDMIELTYEEAEQACLDKLIEICKNKQV